MLATDDNVNTETSEHFSEWHQYVLEQTCSIMSEASMSNESELDQVRGYTIHAWSQGLPCEPLEVLLRLQEPDSSQLEAIMEHTSSMIAQAFSANMLPAPFASTMMTPTSFYEKHEAAYQMAKSFKCPILYNEDADVLGLGSVNPVTATVFGQAMHAYISETQGIRPFISCVRLNYDSWVALCERHFTR
ncbi:hypothetical protein SAMN02745181_3624 [Rubritalea squalenifaciens DSM 18772]|uniref:Uncharacterized protein n=1 Tax=Rubritalea squalenifaciens DSM 18772 TaxID=1123071 RepID=A0A1M6RKH8_9BACT|nr:hypothetical protein [Rubritalea squalenifaciens]SHK32868.1 hypothetical protein SAMN02745181_3624 [Rubritalea squalenifaciens DSM 18772]